MINGVRERILSALKSYSNQPALLDGDVVISYATLELHIKTILKSPLFDDSNKNFPIAIVMEPSCEIALVCIACVVANKTYVPISPQNPSDRIDAILKDLNASDIVCDKNNYSSLEKLEGSSSCWLFELSEDQVFLTCKRKGNREFSELSYFREVQYVLYSSGTTGVPKGIAVTYDNVTSFLDWILDKIDVAPGDRFSGHTEMSFDLSVFDLFVPLTTGGCYCPLSEAADRVFPAEFIRNRRINTWLSVPTVLDLIIKTRQVEISDAFGSLKQILFCGDILNLKSVQTWFQFQKVPVLNLYGPTEATVAVSSFRCHPSDDLSRYESLPIGHRSEPNFLLREFVGGEQKDKLYSLFLKGPQIAKGYWNKSDLSSEKFLSLHGERAYDTGDLVKSDNQGHVFFCGRSDFQIKKEGYRIELSEIDYVVGLIEGVTSSCSIFSLGQIVTFVASANHNLEEKIVMDHCKMKLPHYMLPARVNFLETLPVNVNGKVDRKALMKLAEKTA
ncbi:MAG: AMP-binding protein [Bdellovibrionales bacterium]|nr:AMP-binding protein [Bdellovibrionales bacterium]